MNYLDFKHQLKDFLVFSISDIYKFDPNFDSRRLVEWQDKCYLKKIINRWYYFSDMKINEEFLFLVANRIYSPSYISFETALSYYQLIPEFVQTITSVTSLKTNEFKTGMCVFSYRHLKPSLFFGYRLIEYGEHKIKIAEMEKAILDYLYIYEKANTIHFLEGMRLNKQVLVSGLNIKKMNEYSKIYENKTFERRVEGFIQYLKHA